MIHVRVNEVTAPVTVRNASGEMILDVPKESFHIFDNGVEQKIEHFDLGANSLSIVLAVETSSHIEPMFPAVKQMGLVFTETVMAQTSEVAIVGYDDDVNLLKKFTTDPENIEDVINNLTMGTSGHAPLRRDVARDFAARENGRDVQRRILVVIGEAQDSGSESTLGEVLRQRAARERDDLFDRAQHRDGGPAREKRARRSFARPAGNVSGSDAAGQSRKHPGSNGRRRTLRSITWRSRSGS